MKRFTLFITILLPFLANAAKNEGDTFKFPADRKLLTAEPVSYTHLRAHETS